MESADDGGIFSIPERRIIFFSLRVRLDKFGAEEQKDDLDLQREGEIATLDDGWWSYTHKPRYICNGIATENFRLNNRDYLQNSSQYMLHIQFQIMNSAYSYINLLRASEKQWMLVVFMVLTVQSIMSLVVSTHTKKAALLSTFFVHFSNFVFTINIFGVIDHWVLNVAALRNEKRNHHRRKIP